MITSHGSGLIESRGQVVRLDRISAARNVWMASVLADYFLFLCFGMAWLNRRPRTRRSWGGGRETYGFIQSLTVATAAAAATAAPRHSRSHRLDAWARFEKIFRSIFFWPEAGTRLLARGNAEHTFFVEIGGTRERPEMTQLRSGTTSTTSTVKQDQGYSCVCFKRLDLPRLAGIQIPIFNNVCFSSSRQCIFSSPNPSQNICV